MKIIEFRTQCRRSDILYLVPLGDIHIGTKNCDEKKLIETVEWIKNTPKAYVLGMGDYGEFVNYTDKRYDPSNLSPFLYGHMDDLAKTQADHLLKILEPISGRFIGLIEGNHDDTIRQRYHLNIVDYMCGCLGVPNLSSICMIRWIIHRNEHSSKSVVIWASHGFGAGKQSGGSINALKSVAKDFEADIFLMGHTHKKICEDADRLYITLNGEPQLKAKKQLFGITGTFYKTYEVNSRSYCEKSAYPPTPTGVLKIIVEPFKRSWNKDRQCNTDDPPHLHISA